MSVSLIPVFLSGHCKTIEFAFDMSEDTAECIANEMMEDLSLSASEAQQIAAKIREEIQRTVSTQGQAPPQVGSPTAYVQSLQLQLPQTPAIPQNSQLPKVPQQVLSVGSLELRNVPAVSVTQLPGSADVAPGCSPPTDPGLVALTARASEPSARPPLPSAVSSYPASAMPAVSTTEARRGSGADLQNGRTGKSGCHTPAGEETAVSNGGSLKGLSIHELIAAMKAAQEEVDMELQPPSQKPSALPETQLNGTSL